LTTGSMVSNVTGMPSKKKSKPETLVAESVEFDEEEIEVEEDPHRAVPANRVKAAKLRARIRTGRTLSPEEAAWLADYEAAREDRAEARSPLGASRGRKTTFTEEEHEALGVGGGAAAEAAAAGAMVREEGRRLDSLVAVGITALKEACEIQKGMVKMLLERNRDLESAHVQMMLAAGKLHVRAVENEAELVRMRTLADLENDEEKPDPISELASQILPVIIEKLGGGNLPGPEEPPTK
jgi:hypothetical protein